MSPGIAVYSEAWTTAQVIGITVCIWICGLLMGALIERTK